MKDRIVEFPNRYRVIPVDGTSDIIDLVPVPGCITQEGDPISKATLLKDETAIKYGLGSDATPDDMWGHLVQPGSVFWIAADTAPNGYLLCDGSEVARHDYEDLFAAIGTTFGDGDGSTTFALPDLRAAFIRGAGTQDGYSAIFGEKQEATNFVAGASSFGQDNYTRYSSADKSYWDNWGANGTSSNSCARIWVRPYNLALTPIIKY